MATKYGSLKNSYWKAFMSYTTSSDADSYTVSVSAAGPYASDGWVNYKFAMELTATGKSTSSYGPWQSRIDKGSKHDFISGTKKIKFAKGTSSATKTVKAVVTNKNTGSVSTATLTVTVPALAKYTISYNANGGSGAPASQTKYYGKDVTLSSTKPVRTGYLFKGWSKSQNGNVAYASGAKYTANTSDTLYAVWEARTYKVSFDANGGSGAPEPVNKIYGKTVGLPVAAPSKANYNFKGWASTANAKEAEWMPGGSYDNDITADIVLYAVWELAYIPPAISSLVTSRVNSDGNYDDTGTIAKVRFDWQSGRNGGGPAGLSRIKVQMRESGTDGYADIYSEETGGLSGSVTGITVANVSTDLQYDILVTIADDYGATSRSTYLSKASFLIDVNSDGTGMAFGESAEDGAERLVVNLDTVFRKSVNIEGDISIGDKTYVHKQESASAEWKVTHGLGKYPAVTVVDSAGTEVIGEVDYTGLDKCVLRFQAAFSGKAIFN